MSQPLIAVDWGTTHRRGFLLEDGRVTGTLRDDRGVGTLGENEYPAAVKDLRDRLGDHPMLLAGMVGSTLGWREVPYVDVPAGLDDLAAHLFDVDNRTAIVPGLAIRDPETPDVMRGEEVQFLGAIAAGLVPVTARLCQPGTHCKWARVEDGKVKAFVTSMTGELFALLRTASVLSGAMATEAEAGEDFRSAVRDGALGDLGTKLFKVRARAALHLPDPSATASVSGLLIGDGVAHRIQPDEVVHVIAEPALATLYVAAIETLGGTAIIVDSEAAFVAGMWAIGEAK